MIIKVISGGQRGADIAGLRAAKRCGIETGGWMPRGYRTLDGPRPGYLHEYGLLTTESPGYPERTSKNVRDSDCTIRFASSWSSRGELATLRELKRYGKPWYDVDLGDLEDRASMAAELGAIVTWLRNCDCRVINVAGNADASIEPFVESYLVELIEQVNG